MIRSADPAALFAFFNQTLLLPVAWDFRDYGAFASGGVFAGNCNVEVLGTPADHPGSRARLGGIALEPSVPLERILPQLAAAGVAAGPLKPFTVPRGPEPPMLLWTNLPLPGLLAEDPGVFFCQYAFPGMGKQRENAPKLIATEGGPLGLLGIEEIAVESEASRWTQLLALDQKPRILFREGESEITLRVRELEPARALLSKHAGALQGLNLKITA